MSPAARPGPRTIREPVQLSEPAHDVARALKEVMHAFRTIMEGEMRSRGEALSFAHAMLMMSLAREPGLSGAQAARRSQVTAQTMNGLLRNLESAGYAVREPNPENRRADRWFLTQDGLRHLEQGRIVADGVMRKMLLPLTDRDADRLCELLQKCATALHAIQEEKSDAA
jgi:MarR family transcriptional regulator, organic hydroperoxide resistance regulator